MEFLYKTLGGNSIILIKIFVAKFDYLRKNLQESPFSYPGRDETLVFYMHIQIKVFQFLFDYNLPSEHQCVHLKYGVVNSWFVAEVKPSPLHRYARRCRCVHR